MTNNLDQIILQRVAVKGLSALSESVGHDNSHWSKFHSSQIGIKLSDIEPYLETLGLKVIECEGDVVSVPVDELEALKCLARKCLSK